MTQVNELLYNHIQLITLQITKNLKKNKNIVIHYKYDVSIQYKLISEYRHNCIYYYNYI